MTCIRPLKLHRVEEWLRMSHLQQSQSFQWPTLEGERDLPTEVKRKEIVSKCSMSHCHSAAKYAQMEWQGQARDPRWAWQ
jgi:hypothetical protein